MHVEHALAAGPLVKVVYVLRHEQELVAQTFFKLGERKVRRVGLVFGQALAQEVVEVHHALGVAAERSGRADVLDVLVFPHPVVPAERAESGLGADSGTGQYD